jgi:hypothetical protein
MDPRLDMAIEDAHASQNDSGSQTEEHVAQPIDMTEEHTVATVTPTVGDRQYPSLYDTYGTTFIAIVLAISIVSAVIGIVTYIYHKAKSDHAALTQFVTTMFALIAGVFVADKLVAGPSTELLDSQESLKVLEFIQQTCLMVFAYYFGTKAQVPKEEPPNIGNE